MIKNILILFLISTISVLPQMLGPKVAVQQLDHDFGNINEGDIVKHTYVISNNGGDVFKIFGGKTSFGCTAASPDKKKVKPGE